jgi:hypothetical protein
MALVEFPLQGGGSVVVEVDDDRVRPATAKDGPKRGLGGRDVITQAGSSFEAAIERIQPAAAALVEKLRTLVDAPDEIDVEFGVQLSADVGAIVARTGGEANFKITLRWRRDEAAPAEAPS